MISEKLLIDFRELKGSHTGKNLVAAMWETIQLYGLEARYTSYVSLFKFVKFTYFQVLTINCDNASNNNTMAEVLEQISGVKGFRWDSKEG